MPVYAKLVSASDVRFDDREIKITALDGSLTTRIGVPNGLVICNGCNKNIAASEDDPNGYLVYLGKRELAADRPYDLYCHSCFYSFFPKATIVS